MTESPSTLSSLSRKIAFNTTFISLDALGVPVKYEQISFFCFETFNSTPSRPNPSAKRDYESNYRVGKIARGVISCRLG